MDILPLLGALPAQAAQDVLAQGPSRAVMGLLDIIFLALAGWVAWRVITNLSKRRPPDDDNTYDATPRDDDDSGQDQRSRRAQAAWEYLTGQQGRDLGQGQAQDQTQDQRHEPDPPGTFNQAEFLGGAKLMFGRIKQSWAMRNLSDLRQFTAPDMMARFERWAAERPDRQAVSVLLVEAQVLDVQREEGRTTVEVAYQATVADDPRVAATRKVSEVWRFSRDESVADPKWLLEDMAQRQ